MTDESNGVNGSNETADDPRCGRCDEPRSQHSPMAVGPVGCAQFEVPDLSVSVSIITDESSPKRCTCGPGMCSPGCGLCSKGECPDREYALLPCGMNSEITTFAEGIVNREPRDESSVLSFERILRSAILYGYFLPHAHGNGLKVSPRGGVARSAWQCRDREECDLIHMRIDHWTKEFTEWREQCDRVAKQPVCDPPPKKAMKHTVGKLRYDLLDPHAIGWLVASLTYGVSKYEAWNWRNWSRAEILELYGAALKRHLEALLMGEDDDDETGLPHGAGLLFGAMVIAAMTAPRSLAEIRKRTSEAIRRWESMKAAGTAPPVRS